MWRGLLLTALALGLAGQGRAQSAYDDVPLPIDPASCAEPVESWAERALERSLQAPLGLPQDSYPDDNPPSAAKIALGRKLFFDRGLSINNTMSCAMCHVPEQAFVSWELQTAVGVEGRSVKRNAPTILNVGYLSPLFHDGRDFSLETQFIEPLVARNEMDNPSAGWVVARLKTIPDYREGFDAAFGAPASLDRIGMALGAYQRSVVAGNSAFDRWFYGEDDGAMTAKQIRGYDLFVGKADCASCHLIEEDHALFTDGAFHNTGYGWMREQSRQTAKITVKVQLAPGVVHDVDYARIASVEAKREADLGRYEVTEKPIDRWKFRTASLRNVGMTRPYMHDGALASLGEVIEFYNQGGAGYAGQDTRVRPLGLDAHEKRDLEAFLHALTAPGLECLAAEARSSPPDNH